MFEKIRVYVAWWKFWNVCCLCQKQKGKDIKNFFLCKLYVMVIYAKYISNHIDNISIGRFFTLWQTYNFDWLWYLTFYYLYIHLCNKEIFWHVEDWCKRNHGNCRLNHSIWNWWNRFLNSIYTIFHIQEDVYLYVLHNIFKLVFPVTILVSDVSNRFHKGNNAREQKLNK